MVKYSVQQPPTARPSETTTEDLMPTLTSPPATTPPAASPPTAARPAAAGPPATAQDCGPEVHGTRQDRRWARDAACDGADPALFDPVNRHVAERATAVCATCPVRRACLLEALTDEGGTAYGPWLVRGGLTPKARRDLTRHERSALVTRLTDELDLPRRRTAAPVR